MVLRGGGRGVLGWLLSSVVLLCISPPPITKY